MYGRFLSWILLCYLKTYAMFNLRPCLGTYPIMGCVLVLQIRLRVDGYIGIRYKRPDGVFDFFRKVVGLL